MALVFGIILLIYGASNHGKQGSGTGGTGGTGGTSVNTNILIVGVVLLIVGVLGTILSFIVQLAHVFIIFSLFQGDQSNVGLWRRRLAISSLSFTIWPIAFPILIIWRVCTRR